MVKIKEKTVLSDNKNDQISNGKKRNRELFSHKTKVEEREKCRIIESLFLQMEECNETQN